MNCIECLEVVTSVEKTKREKTKRRKAILNNRLITGYNLLGDIITLSSSCYCCCLEMAFSLIIVRID